MARKKQTRSDRFRRDVEAVFDVESAGPAWRAQFENCCRVMDRGDLLAQEVNGNLLVQGSQSQPRANPLLAELRQTELLLSKMLERLGLIEVAETAGSAHARAAIRQRWSK